MCMDRIFLSCMGAAFWIKSHNHLPRQLHCCTERAGRAFEEEDLQPHWSPFNSLSEAYTVESWNCNFNNLFCFTKIIKKKSGKYWSIDYFGCKGIFEREKKLKKTWYCRVSVRRPVSIDKMDINRGGHQKSTSTSTWVHTHAHICMRVHTHICTQLLVSLVILF